ncbi:MAG: universal stress protein [Thermoplasmatota archaeon]
MDDMESILVPVDGSELSKLAFEKALTFARMMDAGITLVNVIPPIIREQYNVDPDPEPEMIEAVSEMLDELADKVKDESLEIETKIEHGRPSRKIIEMSRDHDLIIMGARGQNPITSLVIGSVSEKVAGKACCPVMLIGERCGQL